MEFIKFVDLVVDVLKSNNFGYGWLYKNLHRDEEDGFSEQNEIPKPLASWRKPGKICGKFPCEHRGRIKIRNATGEERTDWRYGPHSGIYPGSLSEAARQINQALQLYQIAIHWHEDDFENEIIVPSKNQSATHQKITAILGYATKHDCWSHEEFWDSSGMLKECIYTKFSDAIEFLNRSGIKHPYLEPKRLFGEGFSDRKQNRTTLTDWLDREAWSPIQGALLVFGFIPPPLCLELPPEESRLAQLNNPVPDSSYSQDYYFIKKLLDKWEGSLNVPDKILPSEWVSWCKLQRHNSMLYFSHWLDVVEQEISKTPLPGNANNSIAESPLSQKRIIEDKWLDTPEKITDAFNCIALALKKVKKPLKWDTIQKRHFREC